MYIAICIHNTQSFACARSTRTHAQEDINIIKFNVCMSTRRTIVLHKPPNPEGARVRDGETDYIYTLYRRAHRPIRKGAEL